MDILKNAMAGSLESSDCLVTVEPCETLKVKIQSAVGKRFYKHIANLVHDLLSDIGLTSGYVYINDLGALDYCISARLKTAIERGTKVARGV